MNLQPVNADPVQLVEVLLPTVVNCGRPVPRPSVAITTALDASSLFPFCQSNRALPGARPSPELLVLEQHQSLRPSAKEDWVGGLETASGCCPHPRGDGHKGLGRVGELEEMQGLGLGMKGKGRGR